MIDVVGAWTDKGMSFREYQELSEQTSIYPPWYKVVYPALGLAGEAGEVANKTKKVLRDNNGEVSEEAKIAIASEIGDVIWYLAALCRDLELDMGEVAQANLAKLLDRKERGVIGGSGDKR